MKCSAENLSVTALSSNQLSGYGYDAAGNMTHDATTGTNYSFDQENRITGAAGYTYTYDADGNRVEKSNGSTGTIYWSMSPGIVAESDLSGNLTSEYVFFNGERVARKDLPGNSVFYYFSDYLKTASVITDFAGNVKAESDYYPFGGELQITNNDPNKYKYKGNERDNETGLDHMGLRYYSNPLGRFTSVDLLFVTPARAFDPQQLNLYTYGRNNPLRFSDPTGLTIDDNQLNKKDKKKFQHIRDIANQKDKNGNYTHPNLQKVLSALDSDSRTFVIQNTSFGDETGEAGLFTITNFTSDGKDFTSATLQLDLGKIEGLSSASSADILVGDFRKYDGLFDVKDAKGLRDAELFGHEAAHGVYSIQNPADAVAAQRASDDANAALEALPTKGRYPVPPDVQQKLANADRSNVPSERFAQEMEQKINQELRPPK